MKLNKKLITKLRNGEIAAENSGTLEQLTEVLEAAFLEDTLVPDGYYKYYWKHRYSIYDWGAGNSTTLPTISVSDFYQTELFTGWAKDDRYPEWMVYFKNDVAKFGFDASGFWYDDFFGVRTYSVDIGSRPATNEEIETTLTQEAKRIGYKGGETIKGLYSTTHWSYEISSFYYDQRWDRLLTNEGCIVYEKGQWAETVEKPQPKKSNPIHYTVDGAEYSFNYQELKARYEDISQYSDEQFMGNLPQIAHLACIVAYFKGLGSSATIGDKGIIHELIRLMTEPDEPTNDLAEIREKFNKLIRLV